MKNNASFLRLENKVAVVTGAAGIIGRDIASRLYEFGARVALIDVDIQRLAEYAARFPESDRVRVFSCDLTDTSAIVEAVSAIDMWAGGIDILFNNAATKSANIERFFDSVDEYTLETWREVMAVNADGLFVMARECAKRMKKMGGGSIVQTASIYGVLAPDMRIYEGSEYLGRQINTPPIYAASKGAVIALTRYLAALWAKDGIRVNTISPGGVSSGQNEVFHSKYKARVPMERMAEVREITDSALFLASPAASYVTGQNLVVDGGLSIW